MFYDNYLRLCNQKGVSASGAALEMGLSRAAVTGWAQGKVPRDATLRRIADYFGVSVEELTRDQKEKPVEDDGLVNRDAELTKYLDELRNRSEMRMLFSVAKDAKKEDIEALAKFFEQMNGKKDT